MTTTSQGILDAALTLPEPERVFIVESLLESLSGDPGESDKEISAEELDRRAADFEHGTAGETSWSELKRQR
jgi:putative addiction module component (TIGR02574 family)